MHTVGIAIAGIKFVHIVVIAADSMLLSVLCIYTSASMPARKLNEELDPKELCQQMRDKTWALQQRIKKGPQTDGAYGLQFAPQVGANESGMREGVYCLQVPPQHVSQAGMDTWRCALCPGGVGSCV
jgi:hypothetical protein